MDTWQTDGVLMALSSEHSLPDDAAGAIPRYRHQWSQDDLLTSSELAGALKVSERTPENWRLRGEGPPFIRVGGRRVLYRWRDVMSYLDARSFGSTTEEQTAK
jgi:hypothetical protein